MRLTGLWWWIDRWRKSTAFIDMSLEEQGAYRNLLDEAALRGGAIPNSEDVLAKACGDARRWKSVRAACMARFELKPDGWHNETMDGVIAESRRRSDKQRNYRNKHGNGGGNESGNASGNEGGNGPGNNMAPPNPDPVVPPKTGKPRAHGAGSRGGLIGWNSLEHGECLAHGPICLKPQFAQGLRALFPNEAALQEWGTKVGERWTLAIERGEKLYTADGFEFWRTEYKRDFGAKPTLQTPEGRRVESVDETSDYLRQLKVVR